jgi:hypothetical protein
MNSNVVKPTILCLILSYVVFALVVLAVFVGVIWILLKLSPLIAIIVLVLFVAGCFFGGIELIAEIVVDLGYRWFMSTIALRIRPEQVEVSALLRMFFYVDRSGPLTEKPRETL